MNVEELSYRELQRECKDKDLKATGSEEELRQRLKEDKSGEKESSKEEAVIYEVMDDKHGKRKQRVYSRETHGDSFIELAEKYVETRPQEDLEIVTK